MISIPAILKTREDYDRAEQCAVSGVYKPSDVIRHFVGLQQNRFSYVFDRILAEGEAPDGAHPEFRIIEDDETGVRTQLKQEEMANATIFQLGYTVSAVKKIITKLEKL